MKNIIIFFFFAIAVFAQQKIKLHVLNQTDKHPVQFASVLIENKSLVGITDENGFCELAGDISSSDNIIVKHVGFNTKIISARELLNEKVLTLLLTQKLISSQTILVKGSIGVEGESPISFSKLKREDFISSYTKQDIPELLSYLPSVTFYSENGNGIGYNYLSIRGFDQRRISVSINGIPQNDPEDHNVYWLNFSDLIENTDLIQVQRGAGAGAIGYPAIGGSVNIITSAFSDRPRFEISSSLGSYNTVKNSILLSSGLIGNKYSFSAKLSRIRSSGYRENSWADLNSYHLSAVRFDEKLTTQINLFGGPIADGLAYTGIPKFAIKNKELRKLNYSYWEADNNKILYSVKRRADEIENFSQPHFELLNEYKFNADVSINSALFMVLGNGFFDYDASWADTSYFRLIKENGFGATANPGNAIIRAMVNNKQWGWIPKVSIKHQNGELIIGGELRFHNSIHWGSVKHADNLPANISSIYRYYQYNGGKDILSLFLNENYSINDRINILAEAQLSYHNYKLNNEKFLNNEFEVSNIFLNPRFGINYKLDESTNLYLSFARVSREPRLKNYYDAAESSGGEVPQFERNTDGSYYYTKPLVKPETMNNFELGSYYNNGKYSIQCNGYYMLFNDEIVKKGQLDRFGQPITGNMESTIHYGLELSLSANLITGLEFILNGSYSENYISKGNTFVRATVNGINTQVPIDLSKNTLGGFPNSTISSIIQYKNENIFVSLSGRYVGELYTDNFAQSLNSLKKKYPSITAYNDNVVDPYFVVNAFGSYEFNAAPYFDNVKLFFQLNNIFDSLYASYGIGGEFFPAAERNFMCGIKLSL